MNEDIQFIIDTAKEAMTNAIKHLEKQLVNIRAGKASPAMLEGVMVDYYGSPTPLAQVANVSAADPRMLTATPWEKNMIPVIEKAIRDANLGFNPGSDGDMVRIPIPSLTEERRKELVKQAKAEGENAKISLRSSRKSANDELKTMKDAGVSEDDVKSGEKAVQDVTNKYANRVDEKAYQSLLDEMNEEDVVKQFSDISARITANESGSSIAHLELLADTFDRWAEQLVAPSDPSGGL